MQQLRDAPYIRNAEIYGTAYVHSWNMFGRDDYVEDEYDEEEEEEFDE